MALIAKHNDLTFGVGDVIRVHQKIVESGKTRTQVYEGMVMGIKGREIGKTFTLRRIGAQKVGVEIIFPLHSPTVEKIEVKRKGVEGVRHAKLFYTREKSRREIDKIYSRASKKLKNLKKKA